MNRFQRSFRLLSESLAIVRADRSAAGCFG
jgi:hypothetical protein